MLFWWSHCKDNTHWSTYSKCLIPGLLLIMTGTLSYQTADYYIASYLVLNGVKSCMSDQPDEMTVNPRYFVAYISSLPKKYWINSWQEVDVHYQIITYLEIHCWLTTYYDHRFPIMVTKLCTHSINIHVCIVHVIQSLSAMHWPCALVYISWYTALSKPCSCCASQPSEVLPSQKYQKNSLVLFSRGRSLGTRLP